SISFWVGRKWGHKLLHKFISSKHVRQFHAFTEKHGTAAIFFLKLNPVTSFDIWNYLAGAGSISFWKFSIANLLGIFPLVVASAFFGEESFKLAPPIIGILFLATLLYIIWLVIRIPAKNSPDE
ncbi:MAG: VTT domain-containing protein, partial [Candidatus Doudnabacteria bacterium]|nr:VTT domain-containing protein [Candidatus Doudnabacteria bacterium]